MRNNKVLFYAYQIYKYLVMYPLLAISTTVCGLSGAFLSIIFTPKFGNIGGITWAKINSYFTPMFVKVIGRENIIKNQSYIIVSNHQSQYDIYVVYGWLPVDFRWVMKIELRSVPFLGYSCEGMGHVYVDRSNREAALESINSAKEKIKNGTSMMFFVEGTKSNDGELMDFKKGAFRTAIDMGLPVLPITIVGTNDILPNNTTDLFPGKAKLIIHEPINIDGYNEKNIESLIKRAKTSVQKGFDEYR